MPNPAMIAIKKQREQKKQNKLDAKWEKRPWAIRDLIEKSGHLDESEKLTISLDHWMALEQMVNNPSPVFLSDCIFCCHSAMYIADMMERPALRAMAQNALVKVVEIQGIKSQQERKKLLRRFTLLIETIDKMLDSIPNGVMQLAVQASKATENIICSSATMDVPAIKHFKDLLNGKSAKSIAAEMNIDIQVLLGQCEAITLYLGRINGFNEMYNQAIHANTFTKIKAMKKDLIHMLEKHQLIALKSKNAFEITARDYGLTLDLNLFTNFTKQ